jgi:hypothetical protein
VAERNCLSTISTSSSRSLMYVLRTAPTSTHTTVGGVARTTVQRWLPVAQVFPLLQARLRHAVIEGAASLACSTHDIRYSACWSFTGHKLSPRPASHTAVTAGNYTQPPNKALVLSAGTSAHAAQWLPLTSDSLPSPPFSLQHQHLSSIHMRWTVYHHNRRHELPTDSQYA